MIGFSKRYLFVLKISFAWECSPSTLADATQECAQTIRAHLGTAAGVVALLDCYLGVSLQDATIHRVWWRNRPGCGCFRLHLTTASETLAPPFSCGSAAQRSAAP